MCKVLLIGYGKIGAIKASIYKELGAEVFIVDPRLKQTQNVFNNIHQINHIFDFYDICTPTDTHIDILKKLLIFNPKAKVLIEKPLCNSIADYHRYLSLIQTKPIAQIFLSENYLFSSALNDFVTSMKKTAYKIKRIAIEFSKDRREDILNGRFIDTKLGGIGIEVPHMLAILYKLGVKNFSITDLHHSPKKGHWNGENDFLLHARGKYGEEILLYQSLVGNYYLEHKHFKKPTTQNKLKAYRVLYIETTSGKEVCIQFEPIPNLTRFKSIIHNSHSKNMQILNDNTIKVLLNNLLLNTKNLVTISNKGDFISWQTERIFNLMSYIQ